jgi:hypothetical protein
VSCATGNYFHRTELLVKCASSGAPMRIESDGYWISRGEAEIIFASIGFTEVATTLGALVLCPLYSQRQT